MSRALILVLIFIIACKQSDKPPAIEFDYITHYSIQIEDQNLFDLASQDSLNGLEQLKVNLLLNNTPERLSDTLFIKKLETIGFIKTQLNTKQISQLQNLFSSKKKLTNEVHECINIYRDILILKQYNQIKEIAKMCLECEVVKLTATREEDLNLSSGDYNYLKRIMRK